MASSVWSTRAGRLLHGHLPPHRARRARATSPDGGTDAGLDPAWSPTVLRRQQVVHLLTAELAGARSRAPGRPLAELLPLARGLYQARLDHAAALLAAGGEAPEELRLELELRSRRGIAPAAVPRDVRSRT